MRKRKPIRAIGLVAAALVAGGMVAATVSVPAVTAAGTDSASQVAAADQFTTVMWADSITGDSQVTVTHPDGTRETHQEDGVLAARVAGAPSSGRAAVPAAGINPATDFNNPSFVKVNGVAAHWDQCRNTIRYAVNLATVPDARALDEVHQALARLSNVSGFKFTYVGDTKVVPLTGMKLDGTQSAGVPVWSDALLADPNRQADLYIGWSGAAQVPAFNEQGIAAITVPAYLSHKDVNRENEIGLVGVSFNKKYASTLPKGFVDGGRGVIAMHEFAHGMGLDHAAGTEQVMYPVLGSKGTPAGTPNTQWGLGDKAGLQVVGAFGGNSLPGFTC